MVQPVTAEEPGPVGCSCLPAEDRKNTKVPKRLQKCPKYYRIYDHHSIVPFQDLCSSNPLLLLWVPEGCALAQETGSPLNFPALRAAIYSTGVRLQVTPCMKLTFLKIQFTLFLSTWISPITLVFHIFVVAFYQDTYLFWGKTFLLFILANYDIQLCLKWHPGQ